MTAMQLVVDSRDSEEIWLARAAPRRWYVEGFGVRNGPTRYGNVTYALDAMAYGHQEMSPVGVNPYDSQQTRPR